jgi:hypothetical protein
MGKKIKSKISWRKDAPLEMAGFAHGIVTAMTGNASFATPTVLLATLNSAAIRVENAWANRKNGQLGKDELQTSTIALDALLHTQADYVSTIANGNATTIHSAGFVSTQPIVLSRIAKPANPLAPVLTPIVAGGLKVNVATVPDAKLYCFIVVVDSAFTITLNAEGQMEIPAGITACIINSTKHFATFTGLPSLKSVQVAVVASNSSGTSSFSAIATSSTIM